MFDRTYVQAGPREVYHYERRAPTDESVRLLKEMEQAAEKKVTEALRLKNNHFECLVHRFDNPADMRTHYLIRYEVNGTRREVPVMVENWQRTITEASEVIWTAVAEDMTCLMLGKAFKKEHFQGMKYK